MRASPSSSAARCRSSTAPSPSKPFRAATSSSRAAVLVALAAVGEAEQEPRLGRLVRSTDLRPGVAGGPQRRGGTRPVPLRELNLPAREPHCAFERGRAAIAGPERVRGSLELVRRVARPLDLTGGERDLDVRRKPPRAAQRIEAFSIELAPDCLRRSVDFPAPEPEQREPGLRFAAELARLRVCLLRRGEVASSAPDLTDLVVAGGGDERVVVAQLVARLERLLLGPWPLAAEAHDLSPVNAADAREAGDVEPVAPAVCRFRPLGGAPAVAERLAGADRHAVDDPGREGSELAAHGRGGCLVEEGEAGVDVAARDKCRALKDERHRLEAAVAKAGAQLARTAELLLSDVQLPHLESADAPGEREVTVRRVLGLAREEGLGAAQPAGGDGARALDHVIHRQGDREQPGTSRVARMRERCVRPLPQRERLVEPARPPGRLGQALEVVRRELAGFVRGVQEPISVAPRVLAHGRSARFEWIADDLIHLLQSTPLRARKPIPSPALAAHQPEPFG